MTQRFQMSISELAELGARLSGATVVTLAENLPVSVRDLKDEHILAAALGGDADYLVTGGEDLLVLQGEPQLRGLRIVTAAQFLAALHRPESEPEVSS